MNNNNYLPPEIIEYSEYMRELYPEVFKNSINTIKTITFQVTEDCCLNCSYCYQVHNNNSDMDFNAIKIFLDKLFNEEYPSITTENTKGIIWEFIGGEPFIKIDLMFQITDYIYEKMLLLNHPWALYSRISLSSNGILYFDEKVQSYIKKYDNLLSIGISIDGHKELHDACRVDLNGKGSFDRVIKAIRHYKKQYDRMPNIKMTFSPENISQLFQAYTFLIDEGYTGLMGNCVFEEGWTEKDATIFYYQLKQLADFLIDNNLYDKINISFFSEYNFVPMGENDNDNWCGGTSCAMLAVNHKGELYHCIRYMESSLQGDQKPLIIGTIEDGIAVREEDKKNFEHTTNITRRSQSTDECFYCPIAKGCSWCSAYNYQVHGTVNKRATFICIMHKARALANIYFWNKLYNKIGIDKIFKNYLPDEESLKIISKTELDIIKSLERR